MICSNGWHKLFFPSNKLAYRIHLFNKDLLRACYLINTDQFNRFRRGRARVQFGVAMFEIIIRHSSEEEEAAVNIVWSSENI